MPCFVPSKKYCIGYTIPIPKTNGIDVRSLNTVNNPGRFYHFSPVSSIKSLRSSRVLNSIPATSDSSGCSVQGSMQGYQWEIKSQNSNDMITSRQYRVLVLNPSIAPEYSYSIPARSDSSGCLLRSSICAKVSVANKIPECKRHMYTYHTPHRDLARLATKRPVA